MANPKKEPTEIPKEVSVTNSAATHVDNGRGAASASSVATFVENGRGAGVRDPRFSMYATPNPNLKPS